MLRIKNVRTDPCEIGDEEHGVNGILELEGTFTSSLRRIVTSITNTDSSLVAVLPGYFLRKRILDKRGAEITTATQKSTGRQAMNIHDILAREPGVYRGSRLLVVGLVMAALGPYILGPIRVEQLVVYGVATLVLFTFARLKSWAFGLLVCWSCYALSATLAVIIPYEGSLPWGQGDLLAGYDNILLPLAVMLLIWSLVPQSGAELVLRTAAIVAVWAAVVNAVLAVVSSTAPAVFVPLLKPFWGTGEGSVAENAIRMGRFTGIFNSPAEAGAMYSIAAVLVVWVYSHRLVTMYCLITLITVGGMLSVSKVFLLIGLPVMLLLLLIMQQGINRVMVGVVFFAIGVFLLSSTFIQNWAGYDYMVRLLEVPENQSAVEFYTAGRWNDDANMMNVMGSILALSPMVGVGAAGLQTPYDSQWTEAMVFGGMIGVLSIVVVFGILLARFRNIQEWRTRYMAFGLWVVLFVGSFGTATLTSNRTATVVWVVVALLVAIAARDVSEARISRRPASVDRLRGSSPTVKSARAARDPA